VTVGAAMLLVGILVAWLLPEWERAGSLGITCGLIIILVPFIVQWAIHDERPRRGTRRNL
jgi:4-hydroxybenzoate polyprenyltransferase